MEAGAGSTRAVEAATTHRFAFVMHPLTVDYIHRHPQFRWTRFFPAALVERVAARLPPLAVGRVSGGRSAATGQRIEGLLYSLGATPRQLLTRPARVTYDQLGSAARTAAGRGARILGLGAFTKVVGDAGVTVAREAPLPVTTGNSLTIAATLETAKLTALRFGYPDLKRGKVMVVGATGAIGSVCARMLAAATRDVVLVSIEPERLTALASTIRAEVSGVEVVTDTTCHRYLPDCDLVVTATSAFGQRVLDISLAKPGAIILDVALPADLSAEEAALRPDVLVVESGEVVLPGPATFSYDIGLPPGVAYACLAEAAVLAMEGRFECFTLGRDLEVARVKEIYRLFRKHGCEIAPLRAFGKLLDDDELGARRARAAALLADPELLARTRAEAAVCLAKIPPRAKGLSAGQLLAGPPLPSPRKAGG